MRWISTPDSVENNEPTVLALFETLLAVVLYWGIAWAFDTHLHLLVSISVAPLLLLRSPESTEKGVRWFVTYWNSGTKITRKDTPGHFWGMALFAFLVSAACVVGLANTFLGYVGWELFAHALGVGLLVTMLNMIATATAAVMAAVMAAGVVVGAVAGARAEAATIMRAVAIARAKVSAVVRVVVVTAILFVIPFRIAFATGIWLRSLATRVLATLHHPLRGLAELPGNSRRILLAMDSHHAPEVMPGLSAQVEELSLPYWIKRVRVWSGKIRLLAATVIPIFFLPGLLYRWSLKSTCWLYLPLIYLGGGLRWWPHTPKEKELLVASLYKSPEQSIRRWLAIGVAVSLVITTALNYPTFQAEIQASLSDAPKSMKSFLWFLERLEHVSLPYLWAFDFFDLSPWQWLNLLGAALTGVLWIYSDRVNLVWTLAKEKDSNTPPEEAHITRLLWMVRLRNLCILFYIPLALGYAVLALKGFHGTELTGWLGWLGTLYGPYL